MRRKARFAPNSPFVKEETDGDDNEVEKRERHRQNPRQEREKEEEDTPERVIGIASNSKLYLSKRDI